MGLRADLVPSGEQSARGLVEDRPPYDKVLDPINRVFLPRADMVEAAAHGWIDLEQAILEALTSVRRASAVLTYWTLTAAALLAR